VLCACAAAQANCRFRRKLITFPARPEHPAGDEQVINNCITKRYGNRQNVQEARAISGEAGKTLL
jgi:hypothetical protein